MDAEMMAIVDRQIKKNGKRKVAAEHAAAMISYVDDELAEWGLPEANRMYIRRVMKDRLSIIMRAIHG
jgi:hypothetical protein